MGGIWALPQLQTVTRGRMWGRGGADRQRETDGVFRGTQAVWWGKRVPPKRVSPVADATLHVYMFIYTPLHETAWESETFTQARKLAHHNEQWYVYRVHGTKGNSTSQTCCKKRPRPTHHFFFFLAGQRETRVQRLDPHNYVGPWFNAPWNRKPSHAVTHSGE